MKKYFYLVAILFAGLLASCASDDENIGGGGSQPSVRPTYPAASNDSVEYTFVMYATSGNPNLDFSILGELYQNFAAIQEAQGGTYKARLVGLWKATKNVQTDLGEQGGFRYFEMALNSGVTLDDVKKHLEDAKESQNSNLDINKYFVQDFVNSKWASTEFPMNDPDSIAKALKFLTEKAPARKYVLITDNHGGGWRLGEDVPLTRGQVYDDNLGDAYITVDQLNEGVKRSGKKFDVLFCDLCLMGQLENLFGYSTKSTNGQFDICIASAETTTGSNVGQLVKRLAAIGGYATHDQLFTECKNWTIDTSATGYKDDFETYANFKDGADCQDMGCYDLTKIGDIAAPIKEIADWYTAGMDDATKKDIIQKAVLTTLYTTLPASSSSSSDYVARKATLQALGMTADQAAEAIIGGQSSTLLGKINENDAAKNFYASQGNLTQGYPLAYFVQRTQTIATAANNTVVAAELGNLLNNYVTALKGIAGCVCSHSDFTGMDAYVWTSPTVFLNSLGAGYKAQSDDFICYSSWAKEITLETALNTYTSTDFDKQTGWSNFLKKLEFNPCIFTNIFRSVPMYDAKGGNAGGNTEGGEE